MPRVRWVVEVPHLLLLASMFVVAAAVWPSLPSLLPVHWTGLTPAIPMRVDGYGGKVQALLVWPVMATALYVLLLFAPTWSDRYESANGTIGLALLRVSVTALVALQYFAFVLFYCGHRIDLQ